MYRLKDEARAKRLEEWRGDDATALEEECRLLRLLIEEEANAGHVGMVCNLANTLQRTVTAIEAARVRAKDYLPRATVMMAAQALCELIYRRLEGIPDRERFVDGVVDEWLRTPQLTVEPSSPAS